MLVSIIRSVKVIGGSGQLRVIGVVVSSYEVGQDGLARDVGVIGLPFISFV